MKRKIRGFTEGCFNGLFKKVEIGKQCERGD